MKAYSIIIVFALFLAANGCKKEDAARQIDIKTLFSDTAWTGEFKYASRLVPDPFCIRFRTPNMFTWYEIDGTYAGTFTVNETDKSVTLTFSSGSTFTGVLSENKKLINFKYGGNYNWSILNVELNDDPVIETLDGSVWKGESRLSPAFMPRSVIINFKAPGKIDYEEDRTTSGYSNFSNYSYKLEYPVIKVIGSPYFGVIKKGKISGISGTTTFPDRYFNWYGKKQ